MDKDQVIREEAELVLPRFAEEEALMLGQILVQLAREGGHPVVIDIRTANRTLFHAALPGSAPLNDNWARRKSNTALVTQKSTLRVHFENAEAGRTPDRDGLAHADYADHGGAVPVRVRNAGVVAVATVSGLPHIEDHALVVRAIRTLLSGIS